MTKRPDRANTNEDIEIFLKLQKVLQTNGDSGLYVFDSGWSDQRIADELKVSVHSVQRVRKARFGNLKVAPLKDDTSKIELEACKAELEVHKAELNAIKKILKTITIDGKRLEGDSALAMLEDFMNHRKAQVKAETKTKPKAKHFYKGMTSKDIPNDVPFADVCEEIANSEWDLTWTSKNHPNRALNALTAPQRRKHLEEVRKYNQDRTLDSLSKEYKYLESVNRKSRTDDQNKRLNYFEYVLLNRGAFVVMLIDRYIEWLNKKEQS